MNTNTEYEYPMSGASVSTKLAQQTRYRDVTIVAQESEHIVSDR